MEIDPRLHSRGESSSESAESDTEYPEPPSQSASSRPHLPASILNPYTQSGQSAYPGEASSDFHAFRGSTHNDIDPNDPNADPKRQRACESCRQLKVRCEPDLVNPDEPCKRCAKAGRSCVVTVPNRKRQKKTDSRVSELERKIDVLTATLHASQKVDALLPSNSSNQSSSLRDEPVGRRWLVPGQSNSNRSIPSRPGPSGNKRHYSGELKDSRDTAPLSTPSQTSNPSPVAGSTEAAGRQWPAPWSTPKPATREVSNDPDIVERGLVSPGVASDSYTRYVDSMCHHIPMVVFPPGTPMNEVRKHRPVLFHAIVAISVGPFEPSAQNTLLLELYRTIGDRVIVKGEKSLDIVQALLVACAFYTPPENFEEIKFYQLAQLAVAVGMDIGMYRKAPAKGKPFNFIRDFVKNAPVTDPDSPEIRRAWLGCYFISVQTSSALRRPILVRWLPYMDECIEVLENSPDALPSDKKIIQWTKLARIIEEISSRFFADDLGGPSFSESKFQFTLKAFEKQLEHWKDEVFKTNDSAIMTQAQAIVNIYLHENAMILDNLSEENKTADIDISNPAAATRISALSSTLASIHQAIDTICSIPPRDLISVPTVALARTAFAIVALIKLYSIVTAPDSYVGQVIEPQALKVEIYLDKVIAHYTAAGSLAGGVTPGKFSTVMSMLREWFKSRKDQHGDLKHALQVPPGNAPASGTDRNRNTTSQENTPQGNTPLHLLSEVASGEKSQSPSQQQQYQQTYAQSRPGYPLSQPSPDTMAQAPALPPCLSPSQLPSQLHTNTTAAPDSWGQFYPAQTPFDPTTTASPGQQPVASGYPDFSVSGSNTSMMPPSASMGMFAPELGVGLDEQFWSTMGHITGDMMFFPPQGSWPF
ncbi:putative C6 transcription factor (War1) [Aspergillus puulaauensis]|uniref:Zn(2)-C6 fungal-type domain-containing protein n=1 Tax=Aspergillus puulaauensis TaxID=1220207 RepID=A0A7R8AN42_9EURO|nr:uncharacterized protein APUU_31618A [Aspergillus puulaauensis]BCS23393.1 hypothetical protein APUU_31618A [Aspergillus puulaauensis]